MVCLPWEAPKEALSVGAAGYKAAEGYDSFTAFSLSLFLVLLCTFLVLPGVVNEHISVAQHRPLRYPSQQQKNHMKGFRNFLNFHSRIISPSFSSAYYILPSSPSPPCSSFCLLLCLFDLFVLFCLSLHYYLNWQPHYELIS